MNHPMVLGGLLQLIETLRSRIDRHRPILQVSRIRTRAVLIDPLLTALGWNTADPALVTVEYETSNGRADYALLRTDGQPIALVSARRLGNQLRAAGSTVQILRYAFEIGVPFVSLTDGDFWELYSVYGKAQIDQRRIMRVSIGDRRPMHECALDLLMLWQPNLAGTDLIHSRRPIVGFEGVKPSSVNSKPMGPATVGNKWVPLSEDVHEPGASPPSAIMFPDGSRQAIRRWKDVLTSTAEWLSNTGAFSADNMPISATKKKYLVNHRRYHPDGQAFRSPHKIPGTSLLIECHHSGRDCILKSKLLLESLGVRAPKVKLQVARKTT